MREIWETVSENPGETVAAVASLAGFAAIGWIGLVLGWAVTL